MKKLLAIAIALILGATAFSTKAVTPVSQTGPDESGVITFTFASTYYYGTTNGDVDDNTLQAYVEDENQVRTYIHYNSANVQYTSEEKSPTLSFNISNVIVYNGKYTLYVPADYFMVGNDDNDWDWNSAFDYSFEWNYGVDSNDSSAHVAEITQSENLITIIWTNVGSMSAGITSEGAKIENLSTGQIITIPYQGEGDSPYITITTVNQAPNNEPVQAVCLNFNPTNAQMDNGEYKLTIPAGFINFDDGSSNSLLEYIFDYQTFEYMGVNFYGPTKTMGGNNPYSATESVISIEFNGMKAVSYQPLDDFITINGVNVPSEAFSVSTISGNVLDINLSKVSSLINGDNNELVIPDGVLNLTSLNNRKGINQEETYTFKWDASVTVVPTVTLNFTINAVQGSEVENPEQGVKISYWDLIDGRYQAVHVPVDSWYVSVDIPSGKTIDLTPNQGYMISEVYSKDIVINSEGVADMDAVWSFTAPENGGPFFITVNVDLVKPSVYIEFETSYDDFMGSPQDLAKLTYPGDFSTTDNGYRIYLPSETNIIVVAPVTDYEISKFAVISSDKTSIGLSDLESYGVSYSVADGIYTFTMTSEANGLHFMFDMEPTVIKGTDITINYTGENLNGSVWTYVTTRTLTSIINVSEDSFTYTYTTPESALDLFFIPNDSDIRLEVVCVTPGGINYGEVSGAPSTMGDNAVQLSIPLDETSGYIPEGLVINVTVQQNINYVTANFILSGSLANLADAVSVTFENESVDFSGSTFSGVTVEPGTLFTVTPSPGFTVKNISTVNENMATIINPVDEDGAWTITLSENPDNTSATFTIDLEISNGIISISDVAKDDVIYNINGLRISKNNFYPGLFIINGKKVLVK